MKKSWLKYFEKQREGLYDVVDWDEFDGWENDERPESEATDDFLCGLTAVYCDDNQLKEQFFNKSDHRIERAILERVWSSDRCKYYFPLNRGELYRIKVYVEALKTNELDSSCLIQAANDYEQYALQGTWNDYKQGLYIDSMMMRLIAGDLEPLFESLKLKISFEFVPVRFKLIFGLVVVLQREQENLPLTIRQLHEKGFGFFELVRSPDFQLDEFVTVGIFRFEFAAILYKYFISKTGEIDWNQVIKMISE